MGTGEDKQGNENISGTTEKEELGDRKAVKEVTRKKEQEKQQHERKGKKQHQKKIYPTKRRAKESTQQISNGERCKKCNKKFTLRMRPLSCFSCKERFHKAKKCSGLSRDAADNITKWNWRWTCRTCKNPEQQADETVGEEEDEVNRRCMAVNCLNRAIRRGSDHLKCTQCDGRLQKKEDCSEMTRGHLLNLDRNSWICDGCKGIKTKKEQPEQATTTRYKVKLSGKGLEKLTLLQWNADAYLSKKEEFSQFIL